jgi:hypothetical protein
VKNPFELVTASKLSAPDAVDLWCDDKRLDRISGKENCFINGHRGTGKSMLFRILQHDCQELLHPTAEPDFLAVYFSVRDSEFLTEELDLFQSDAQKNILSESHFSLLVLKQLFLLLQSKPTLFPETGRKGFIQLTSQCFKNAFQYSIHETPSFEDGVFEEFLAQAVSVLEQERVRLVTYIGLRLYDSKPFEGPLFLFDTLLGPIADFFSTQVKKCLYILIDDADDLPISHTIVLNSWIARRRESAVFKVSTMFGYKTYETRTRSAIQHPHDFFQYDIATRYMSDAAEDYVQLLRDICTKRLQSVGIETSPGKTDPAEFFPEDVKQQNALNELAAELEVEYAEKYKGRAVRDYVYRHFTSEYMQRLADSRSPDSFMYSGFKTLAILSSGLVRDFIICAQRMFDNAARGNTAVTYIPPAIQNSMVRFHADSILEEISNPKQKRALDSSKEDWEKIHKLIEGLGNLYKQKMFSKDSERRVFSFAFQNEPGEKIVRLLELAIAEGYLMKGFISKKEGTGRRTLYVLTRRLAPAFCLDVSAYSGYLSLTADRILKLAEVGAIRAAKDSGSSEQMSFYELDDGASSEMAASNGWVFISPEEAGL